MKSLLARYACPECGSPLSRTALSPRWPTYELQFPSYRVPVLPICLAIVVVGFGLAFISLALATIGVVGIGCWAMWRYYSALQCDGCGKYFISGQFVSSRHARVEWRASDTKVLARRVLVVLGVFSAVFLPIHLGQHWYFSTCSANCAKDGLVAFDDARVFKCRCVQPGK